MIVVRVELHSAIDGRVEELGRMVICNDGTGTPNVGNYDGMVMRKPDFSKVTRRGRLVGHRRQALTVWHLVGRMLVGMGYGR